MLLYFLGTGAGKPSSERNVSSIALQLPQPTKEVWLFDCGEGTQHQVLRSPFNLHKVTRVFLTHLHGDHIFGLPGLLGSRSFTAGDIGLTIYGPSGIRRFLEVALAESNMHLSYPLMIQEVEPNESINIAAWKIQINLLEHGLPCFGYRIEEPSSPGKLDMGKLQELNIPVGPIYGRLKGGESIRLESGQILHGCDFVGPPRPGRQIVILGDTRFSQVAANADVLVHEATFAAALKGKAREYYHSTTTQAALVAKAANVRRLILTHISSRYRPDDYEGLLAEARSIFPGTYLAEDHFSLEIPQNN